MGYLNNEKETRDSLDDDHHLHTGDLGAYKDGLYYITGRAKDVMKTAGGEMVPPSYIEGKLLGKLDVFVSGAVVVGDCQKFLTVLFALKVSTRSLYTFMISVR